MDFTITIDDLESAVSTGAAKFTASGGGSGPIINSITPMSGSPNVATTITLTGTNFGTNLADIQSVSYGPPVALGGGQRTFLDQNTASGAYISYFDQNTSTVVIITKTDINAGDVVDFAITVAGSTSPLSTDWFTATGGGGGGGSSGPAITSITPISGSPNVATTITLTGTNFGASATGHLTAATYGGTTRTPVTSFTWLSQNSATVVTGTDIAPGQTVDFTVTVDGTTSARSSALFTADEAPGTAGSSATHAQIFVANGNGNSVGIFGPTAANNVAPSLTLSGDNPGFNTPLGVAVNASSLFVTTALGTAIKVFSLPTVGGDILPTSTITMLVNTTDRRGTPEPLGIAADATNIYVSNIRTYANVPFDEILVFSATQTTATVAPTKIISGSNTGLNLPQGVAVDATNLYVANVIDDKILIFALSSLNAGNNNIAPPPRSAVPGPG